MSAKHRISEGHFDSEIEMLWSPTIIRIVRGGNWRECEKLMNEDKAREWCFLHGVRFVDVSKRAVLLLSSR